MNLKHMNDPFEPTPALFHNRVEQRLKELKQSETSIRRSSYRWVAVSAACLVLAWGTAVALNHFGVFYFLTERIYTSSIVEEKAIVQPAAQNCDSSLVDAFVQDAYWDGETLSITMSIQPKGDYAFYTETDRGQDGESFDKIWWQGEILPFEEWRAGRQALMLELPSLMIDGVKANSSWDWVQFGQGETMLLEGHALDLTHGAQLTIMLTCVLEGMNQTETAAVNVTLPPMTKGEIEE